MSEVPAEAITDFEDLYVRRTSIHGYRVLNLAGETPTAYAVDVADMTCSCPDHEYRREDGETCKHLAMALFQADSNVDLEVAMDHQLRQDIQALTEAVQGGMDAAEAMTTEETTEETDDQSEASESTSAMPPKEVAEEIAQQFVERGLDREDLAVWYHEDYDSIQMEATGYLDDTDFAMLQTVQEELGMEYHGGDDVNYLSLEDAREAINA
jgi:uncharacterized Zn finger protein